MLAPVLSSLPKSIGQLSSLEHSVPISIAVVFTLLLAAIAVIFAWQRVGWVRWFFLVLFSAPLLMDAYAIAIIREEAAFFNVLFGLVTHNWIYWVDGIALVMLFAPPSNRWFREGRHAAT